MKPGRYLNCLKLLPTMALLLLYGMHASAATAQMAPAHKGVYGAALDLQLNLARTEFKNIDIDGHVLSMSDFIPTLAYFLTLGMELDTKPKKYQLYSEGLDGQREKAEQSVCHHSFQEQIDSLFISATRMTSTSPYFHSEMAKLLFIPLLQEASRVSKLFAGFCAINDPKKFKQFARKQKMFFQFQILFQSLMRFATNLEGLLECNLKNPANPWNFLFIDSFSSELAAQGLILSHQNCLNAASKLNEDQNLEILENSDLRYRKHYRRNHNLGDLNL